MAKSKKIGQKNCPKGKWIPENKLPERSIPITQDPDAYYSKNPSWCFNSCDEEHWMLDKSTAGDLFWVSLLPRMKELEKLTWKEILLDAKKENHSINVSDLQKDAQKRLEQKYIEADSIISLRIQGAHRLYGYMNGAVFCILWYDTNHGDNNGCVCRSMLKHT